MCLYFLEQNKCCRSLLCKYGVALSKQIPLSSTLCWDNFHTSSSSLFPFIPIFIHCSFSFIPMQGGRMLAAHLHTLSPCSSPAEGAASCRQLCLAIEWTKAKAVKPWCGHGSQDQICCLHAALPVLLRQLMLFCSQVFFISKKKEIPGEDFINVLTNANILLLKLWLKWL